MIFLHKKFQISCMSSQKYSELKLFRGDYPSIPMIAKQAFNRQQIAYIDRCGGNLKFKQIQ